MEYKLLGIFLLFVIIFLHEYGHSSAMNKYGIKIKKLSVGLDIPYFTLRIRNPKLHFGIPIIHISPLLICGSVEMEDPESLNDLGLAEQLEIYGSGVVMNLVVGLFLIMLAQNSLYKYGIFFCIISLIVLFLEKITKFLLPLVSLAMICYLPKLVFDTLGAIPDAGKLTSDILIRELTGFQGTFLSFGFISIAIAIINLFPIQPLDGGKIIYACGKKWLPSWVINIYNPLNTIIMLFLVLVNIYDLI
jgi:membrane-associated protease RseP (regulator of RpoE activity)